MRVRRAFGLLFAALMVPATVRAHGSPLAAVEPASDHAQSAYDALGVRLGPFLVLPSFEFRLMKDDNVLAEDSNEVEDVRYVYAPALLMRSNWSRHFLSLAVDAEIMRLHDESDEEYEDWGVVSEGWLDVSPSSRLAGKFSFQNRTEDRADIDAIQTVRKPIEYDELAAVGSFRERFNRIELGVGGSFTRLDYYDAPRVGGGEIDADFRDRHIWRSVAQLDYSLGEGKSASDYRVFLRGTANTRLYDHSPPKVPFKRDSHGYALVVGLKLPLTNLLTGEISWGYMDQRYDDSAFRDVEGASFGVDFEYAPTRLTTLRLHGTREVVDSTTPGVGGILTTQVGLALDHELRRNLLLGAQFSFTNGDFKGIDREDDVISASAGLTYLVNRRVHVDVEYRLDDRESEVPFLDYRRNQISIGVRLQH